MTQVKFLYKLERDAWNIWDKCNHGAQFGNARISQNLKLLCEGKSFKDSKKNLVSYLKKNSKPIYMKEFLRSCQKIWDTIEKDYFKRMSKIMKRKYLSNIKAYATTISICPYDPDEPSFMVSTCWPVQSAMLTCGHEIMHLYFHKFYWEKVEKEIGRKKTADLKEALTVILNEEFHDLWYLSERGYEEHKELREFILKSWKKEKDFDVLIKKCVVHLSK